MSLKNMFNVLKKEGYVLPVLDRYLLSLNDEDTDRAINVNSPSQAGTCMRARYYSRIKAERDINSIDARTRRIFDNGTKTHERLQEYLLKQGMLLLDEVPVFNIELIIQGHTDGLLDLSNNERAVLEIKSINDRGFTELKDSKPEHRLQGLVYLYCLEERRKYLIGKYADEKSFNKSYFERRKEHRKRYLHLKDGSKHTKEEKINYQVELNMQADKILFNTKKPITKVIFIYENKNDQNIKEYVLDSNSVDGKLVMKNVINDYVETNRHIKEKDIPKREGTKSSNMCRWCAYTTECFN